MRNMTDKEIKEEIVRFIECKTNNGMFLIRETSNAYKCDRFLWQWSRIQGSGRFHTAGYKARDGKVILYGKYKNQN
jgi:hypothetical protein